MVIKDLEKIGRLRSYLEEDKTPEEIEKSEKQRLRRGVEDVSKNTRKFAKIKNILAKPPLDYQTKKFGEIIIPI